MARKLKSLKEQTKEYYQIRFRTPGFGNDRFEMSSGSKDRRLMESYRAKLKTLYQEGKFAVLEAVKARRIGLPALTQAMDREGVKGAVDLLQRLDQEREDRSVDLEPLLDEFIRDPNHRAAEKTLSDYERQVRTFIEFADQELNGAREGRKAKPAAQRQPVTLKHLDRDRISRWVRQVESRGSSRFKSKERLAPRTAIHHRASLSAFCSWLVEQGHLRDNPVQRTYRPRKVQEDPVYMTREQWHLFRAESEAYDAEREFPRPLPDTVFWKFLVATGATTYNEGCRVKVSDIHVRQDPTSPVVRIWLGGTKTANRQRSVWIPRALADEVLAWARRWGRAPNEPIFVFEKWEGHHYFQKVCKRLAQKGLVEFDAFFPYALRHTYAVHMIQGDPERGIPGVDIVTLARLMGHGDNIQTTMIYARHVGDYAARGCHVMAETLGLDS